MVTISTETDSGMLLVAFTTQIYNVFVAESLVNP